MKHPDRTISLAALAVVLLTGCSTVNIFNIVPTVKNAETGQPVAGVNAVRYDDFARGTTARS